MTQDSEARADIVTSLHDTPSLADATCLPAGAQPESAPKPVVDPERAMPAPLALLPLLGFAFLMRVPAILWSRGYEFFDEQFQYLDPAYHLATGAPFLKTHEWVLGLRSWVYPWLLSCLLRAARACGIESAGAQLVFVRAALAVVSLLAVVGFHQLVTRHLRGRRGTAVLLLATGNGILVYQSVHPNGPALSCILTIFAVGIFSRRGRARALAAGVALGLAFCCRPQDALFAIALFVAGLGQRRKGDTLAFGVAFLALVGVQGLVDWATWGSFLHSPIAYFRFNLRHMGEWGKPSPWLYAGILILIAPALHVGAAWLWQGARKFPWVAFAAFLPLAAHQILERKAPRFVTPSLVLVIFLWAVGVATTRNSRRRWIRMALVFAGAFHVAFYGLAVFSYSNRHRIETASFLTRQDGNEGVIYCDLSTIDMGGAFYYRSSAPRYSVQAAGLPALMRRTHPTPTFLVARRSAKPSLPAAWRLEAMRSFSAVWDPRHSRCFTVYRIVPAL